MLRQPSAVSSSFKSLLGNSSLSLSCRWCVGVVNVAVVPVLLLLSSVAFIVVQSSPCLCRLRSFLVYRFFQVHHFQTTHSRTLTWFLSTGRENRIYGMQSWIVTCCKRELVRYRRSQFHPFTSHVVLHTSKCCLYAWCCHTTQWRDPLAVCWL